MPHIKPTREQLLCLADDPNGGPVVMLNLLRFADRTSGEGDSSGARSFETYGEQMREIMARRGIKLLWRGRADQVVIGDDEADKWDLVLLVEYPSRKAFLEMGRSEEYAKVGTHRTSALVDSRLIACTEQLRAK